MCVVVSLANSFDNRIILVFFFVTKKAYTLTRFFFLLGPGRSSILNHSKSELIAVHVCASASFSTLDYGLNGVFLETKIDNFFILHFKQSASSKEFQEPFEDNDRMDKNHIP